MSRKALFFDIDGTLYSEIDKQVPQSAVLALIKARENGHLVFINTGRTYSQTASIRREIASDGLLCGCGTQIVIGDKVLYDRVIPKEQRITIKQGLDRYNLEGVLEGVESCTLKDHDSRFNWIAHLRHFFRSQGAFAEQGYTDDEFAFSKFCLLADEKSDPASFFDMLTGFQVIDRGNGFYECVPDGHSKATAIDRILREYGIPKKDAWVFGDSMNDLSMFEYSDNGVLMGKHDAGLKPHATFLTKTVEEDGIAYALQTLQII